MEVSKELAYDEKKLGRKMVFQQAVEKSALNRL